jgi:hypothetical protein
MSRYNDRWDTLSRSEQSVELFEKTGAGEGIRTLDPNLGKVVLYP